MKRIHKDMRPLVRELEANGCQVVPGGKHFIVLRGTTRVATLPGSPGDRRNFLNNRAHLRRLGLIG